MRQDYLHLKEWQMIRTWGAHGSFLFWTFLKLIFPYCSPSGNHFSFPYDLFLPTSHSSHCNQRLVLAGTVFWTEGRVCFRSSGTMLMYYPKWWGCFRKLLIPKDEKQTFPDTGSKASLPRFEPTSTIYHQVHCLWFSVFSTLKWGVIVSTLWVLMRIERNNTLASTWHMGALNIAGSLFLL